MITDQNGNTISATSNAIEDFGRAIGSSKSLVT